MNECKKSMTYLDSHYPGMTVEQIIDAVRRDLASRAQPDTPETVEFFGGRRTPAEIADQFELLSNRITAAVAAIRKQL
jgi:hypothetical protein